MRLFLGCTFSILEAQTDSCHYLDNYSGIAFSPKCICIVFLCREWIDEYTCPASHSLHLLPTFVLLMRLLFPSLSSSPGSFRVKFICQEYIVV